MMVIPEQVLLGPIRPLGVAPPLNPHWSASRPNPLLHSDIADSIPFRDVLSLDVQQQTDLNLTEFSEFLARFSFPLSRLIEQSDDLTFMRRSFLSLGIVLNKLSDANRPSCVTHS